MIKHDKFIAAIIIAIPETYIATLRTEISDSFLPDVGYTFGITIIFLVMVACNGIFFWVWDQSGEK